MKSKLDFTKDKLKVIVLELANLNGYKNPSTYLDELLFQVKAFESKEMTFDFYLTIHYLCKENQDSFWSDGHRKDITKWLKKAKGFFKKGLPDGTFIDLFDTTWLPNETDLN